MNLEDVVDPECGLHQDEWSLTAPRFGEEGQLEVIGWSGKQGSAKYYILKCNKCSQDPELFSNGYFKSTKQRILAGYISCGCGKTPRWTNSQMLVRANRAALKLDSLVTSVGDWNGSQTKINLLCKEQHAWSGTIASVVHGGYGCPVCSIASQQAKVLEYNNTMRDKFLDSKNFHPDTKFWRSSRTNTTGAKVYWFMSCPECGEVGEGTAYSFKLGCRPCACSKHRQQECYINWIVDDSTGAMAIKFGIANITAKRVKSQNYKAIYEVRNHCVYTFPSVQSCKAAERECKETLICGVISKEEMPDGYTETTFSYNIDKIKQIYSSHGGVCILNSEDIKHEPTGLPN